MRRRLKPQGLFQGAGGNRSWRAPRGARECSPWRAAERGGGPGARSSRRRICPAPAPGGVAGVVRAAAPGSRVRLPGWVRSAGRGPAAVPARAAAAAASRAPGTSAGRPPLPSRRRRGPCVQARSGEGGKEKGEAASGAGGRAGRRRRGRGRRAAHWPAGPGAGGCAAARGHGPSQGETASTSYPCLVAKMAGGWKEEVWKPAPPGGEEGGSQSQPPARGRGRGKGVLARAASPYTPFLCTHSFIFSFQLYPSIHSFIRPPMHSFANRYPTAYSACESNPFLPAWCPFLTKPLICIYAERPGLPVRRPTQLPQ